MTDDDDAIAPRLILFGQEITAESRRRAQHGEHPRRDGGAAESFWIRAAGQVERSGLVSGDLFENGRHLTPAREIPRRDAEHRKLRKFRFADEDEAIRVLIR